MRTPSTVTTVLAVLAATPLIATTAPALAASPGGAAAPPGKPAPASATRHRVRPSAVATWFGPGFYGKQTACGQTLTPNVVGVANRTLPCGTLVKVTYGKRSLTIPVLDRGPYSHIADWDLTAGAAEALGISETVRIGTRVVGNAPNTPTLGLPAASATAPLAGGVPAS
jgi:rare lipoprotein A (peptidoglycan hydrolase)